MGISSHQWRRRLCFLLARLQLEKRGYEWSFLFCKDDLLQTPKWSEVEVYQALQIVGFRAKDFIEFIIEECDASECLLDNYADYSPNRQWLVQLCRHLIISHCFRQLPWQREISSSCLFKTGVPRAASFKHSKSYDGSWQRICRNIPPNSNDLK